MKENEAKAGLTAEHTFKPKITNHIPNFNQLHTQLQCALEQRKESKSLTTYFIQFEFLTIFYISPQPFKRVLKNENSKQNAIEKVRQKLNEDIKKHQIPFKSRPLSRSSIQIQVNYEQIFLSLNDSF